jgi:hypothetical protein
LNGKKSRNNLLNFLTNNRFLNCLYTSLQEVILDHGEKDSEDGRIPRTIECELFEDLCEVCQPG